MVIIYVYSQPDTFYESLLKLLHTVRESFQNVSIFLNSRLYRSMLPFTGWIAFTGLWCLYRSVGPLHYREAFKSPCDFYKSVWPLQIYVAFTGPCGLYRSVWSVQAHITFTGTCDFYRYVWPSLKSLKANTTYQCSHDYYYRKKDRDSSDIFFLVASFNCSRDTLILLFLL